MAILVKYVDFCDLKAISLGKTWTKQEKQTFSLTTELSHIDDAYSLMEKNFHTYKFHLENGNLKKLALKYLETSKTSSSPLEWLVMIGNTS